MMSRLVVLSSIGLAIHSFKILFRSKEDRTHRCFRSFPTTFHQLIMQLRKMKLTVIGKNLSYCYTDGFASKSGGQIQQCCLFPILCATLNHATYS